MDVDLKGLLDGFDDHIRTEFGTKPDVVEEGDDLDLSTLAVNARRWARLDEIVVVVADLKNSTRLGTGSQHKASTASIYEAATRPIVETFDEFDADDIAIQGDGAFAVFWGEKRFQRAMCAGITIKTFSEKHLIPQLEEKWPALAEHSPGFKIGVAASDILVKRVGIARTEHQEEVWAGKAVNYAAKAAQVADRHELIVTGSVWDNVANNDYIRFTCSCGTGPSPTLWQDIVIDRIPETDEERLGRKLTSQWCDVHGPEFCQAILDGETKRDDVDALRQQENAKARADVLRFKASETRKRERDLRRVKAGR